MEHSGFSELPELNHLILLNLNYPEILQVSQTCSEYYRLCSDQHFWRMKLDRDYPGASQFKSDNLSYSALYQQFYQSRSLDTAIMNDHLHVLKLLSRYNTLSVYNANYAAETGRLEILKWMSQLDRPILPNFIGANSAAENNFSEVTNWLRGLSPPILPIMRSISREKISRPPSRT